ncbi:MAG: TIR domain-containing protein [Syntrophomonas sp.]
MAKRVFFSFHYRDVIDFRANVVRNHKTTKHESAGYFDASLWEKTKRESDLALKRLINGGLNNTSVTAVLIGTSTYSRRWVRYEIAKSFEKGNKLIGIHINGIADKNGRTKTRGLNPFDYMGVEISDDGKKLTLIEKKTNWIYYEDLSGWTVNITDKNMWGKVYTLRDCLNIKTYDWINNNGYKNFENWIV